MSTGQKKSWRQSGQTREKAGNREHGTAKLTYFMQKDRVIFKCENYVSYKNKKTQTIKVWVSRAEEET